MQKLVGVVLAVVVGLAIGCGADGKHDGCCKFCDQGKACGDTCIARDHSCNVGPGCACD
jgi:hypothetical protein